LSRTVESLVQTGMPKELPAGKTGVQRSFDSTKRGAARDRINSTWNQICRDMFEASREKHDQLLNPCPLWRAPRLLPRPVLSKRTPVKRKPRVQLRWVWRIDI
jgi:hypothetical protein